MRAAYVVASSELACGSKVHQPPIPHPGRTNAIHRLFSTKMSRHTVSAVIKSWTRVLTMSCNAKVSGGYKCTERKNG